MRVIEKGKKIDLIGIESLNRSLLLADCIKASREVCYTHHGNYTGSLNYLFGDNDDEYEEEELRALCEQFGCQYLGDDTNIPPMYRKNSGYMNDKHRWNANKRLLRSFDDPFDTRIYGKSHKRGTRGKGKKCKNGNSFYCDDYNQNDDDYANEPWQYDSDSGKKNKRNVSPARVKNKRNPMPCTDLTDEYEDYSSSSKFNKNNDSTFDPFTDDYSRLIYFYKTNNSDADYEEFQDLFDFDKFCSDNDIYVRDSLTPMLLNNFEIHCCTMHNPIDDRDELLCANSYTDLWWQMQEYAETMADCYNPEDDIDDAEFEDITIGDDDKDKTEYNTTVETSVIGSKDKENDKTHESISENSVIGNDEE